MKKLFKVILPILVIIGVYTAATWYSDTRKSDATNLTIQVSHTIDGETTNYELKRSIKDETTLGEVLDSINEEGGEVFFVLEGDKDSEFGRFLSGVNDVLVEDMSNGPWWFYNSETNQDCLDLGFCNGVDAQSIFEGDIFTFVYE